MSIYHLIDNLDWCSTYLHLRDSHKKKYMMISLLFFLGYVLPNTIFIFSFPNISNDKQLSLDWSSSLRKTKEHNYLFWLEFILGQWDKQEDNKKVLNTSSSETPRPFTLFLPGFGNAEDTIILPEFSCSPTLTPVLEVQCCHK